MTRPDLLAAVLAESWLDRIDRTIYPTLVESRRPRTSTAGWARIVLSQGWWRAEASLPEGGTVLAEGEPGGLVTAAQAKAWCDARLREAGVLLVG